MWHRKKNTNCAHWCFCNPLWGFVSQVHWWCLKKNYFSAGFWGFLHLLSKPFVSCVGLSCCWFWFSLCVCVCFCFFVVVVVWQIKLLCSGFCFCCFGFPWFGYGVCVVFFWFLFFGGFKGQVRWPKGPLRLALKPSLFVLFCFCFVSACFVLVVGFCLLFCFCFCFIWKGLRVKWGGPLGHLTWPLNPP